MGFLGVAEATTLIGDVTLVLSVGFETVKGKSLDPEPQAVLEGSCAVGAGRVLVLGDQVMGTGGVDGNDG